MDQTPSRTRALSGIELDDPEALPVSWTSDYGQWVWALRFVWAVCFAAPLICFLLAESSDDRGDGTSAADGWMSLALFVLFVLLVMSSVMSYFTFRPNHVLRSAGWWLLTAGLAVGAAVGIALPWLRPAEKWSLGSGDMGDTGTLSIHDQLMEVPNLVLLFTVVALAGAVPGLLAALIVRYRARRGSRS